MTEIDKEASETEPGSGSTFVPVEPFEIIVFGGTGDLARRKLLPSLYHRYRDGQISDDSRIVGVSRSKHSRQDYQALIEKYYHEFAKDEEFDPKLWAKFIKLVDYVSIDVVNDKDWSALNAALSPKSELIRVFYLAMPPRMFADICVGLKDADLVHDKSRVVLEKPLGTDYESARKINQGVGKVFKENNIYRICLLYTSPSPRD